MAPNRLPSTPSSVHTPIVLADTVLAAVRTAADATGATDFDVLAALDIAESVVRASGAFTAANLQQKQDREGRA